MFKWEGSIAYRDKVCEVAVTLVCQVKLSVHNQQAGAKRQQRCKLTEAAHYDDNVLRELCFFSKNC